MTIEKVNSPLSSDKIKVALRFHCPKLEDIQPLPHDVPGLVYQYHRPLRFVKLNRRLRKIRMRKPWLMFVTRLSTNRVTNREHLQWIFEIYLYDRRDFADQGAFSNSDDFNREILREHIAEQCNIVASVNIENNVDFNEHREYYYQVVMLRLWIRSIAYIRDIKKTSNDLNRSVNGA